MPVRPIILVPALLLLAAPAIHPQSPAAPTLTAFTTAPYAAVPSQIRFGTPITFSGRVLPADSTGTLTFLVDGVPTHTAPLAPQTLSDSIALGDDIPYAGYIADPTQRYPALLAQSLGLTATNLATPGTTACDLMPLQILPNGVATTPATSPLYSLLVGANDIALYGTGGHEALFNTCHQAALAWLAIPRSSKLLAGDPGITSGGWTTTPAPGSCCLSALTHTSGTGPLHATLTTTGAPIYLWYVLQSATPGSFTVSIDGNTPSTPIQTQLFATPSTLATTYALERFAMTPGTHTIDITPRSGTISILALGSRPATPTTTVLAADIPNQTTNDNSNAIATYTADIQTNIALLQADGLDIRFVPTQQFMIATPAEMADPTHPNTLGLSEIAQAFESVAAAPTPTTAATASFTTSGLPVGTHTINILYSGHQLYSPSTSLSVNVSGIYTTTSLSTPATRYFATVPVVLTATVSPASTTGSITFSDGTTILGQSTLSNGIATFTTAILAPGFHSLVAAFPGDTTQDASQSPALAVEIDLNPTTVTLSPLPSSIPYGTPLTLTASLQPSTATGTITFLDGTTLLGQSPLVNGTATLTATSLAPGTHTFTATYPGDTNDSPSTSAPVTTHITPLASTTTLAPLPASVPYGTPLTLTTAVQPSTATGTLTFLDGGIPLGQPLLVNGTATLTATNLTTGTHTFTAIYSGDTNDSPSTSTPVTTHITPIASTITLAPLPSTINAGAPIILTATISPTAATGTVLFRDATLGVLGQSLATNGIAILTLASPAPGTYSITATYSGDANDTPATSTPIATHILLNPTSITLTASPTTAAFAAPFTLTAAITPTTATGTATFFDGPSILGTSLITNGIATLTATILTPGPHTLHAAYSGDTLYATSTSTSILASITLDPTAATLALAQNPVPANALVIADVRVTSSNTNPTGTVTLRSGATILTSAPLANSSANSAYATLTFSAATLGPGTFPLTATYSGDLNNQPSDTSATPAAITIAHIATTATLTLSAAQIPIQSSATLTATVASANAPATGAVTFLSNGIQLAIVPLSLSGTASYTFAAAATGTFTLTSTYAPTGLYLASSTPPQTLTVTPPLSATLNPTSVSADPGGTASTILTLTPLSGFTGPIVTTCQPSYAYITCSVTRTTALTTPIQITVAKTRAAFTFPVTRGLTTITLALLLPFLTRRKSRRALPFCALFLTWLSLTGCAEGGNFFDILPSTQTVAITTTAAGTTITTALTVNITN